MSARRILAVDDDPSIARLLQIGLREFGNIETANSGPDALQRLEETPLPELILLDAMMPGMDGFEVCQRVKQTPRLADIPIIFVTGDSEALTETRALQAGAADFITKPFNIQIVKARIRTQLMLIDQQQSLREANRILERHVAEKSTTIESLLTTIPDPIWFKSPDGHYLKVNPAALKAFGRNTPNGPAPGDAEQTELFGQAIADKMAPYDLEILNHRKQLTFELECIQRDAERTLHWEIIKTPVIANTGEIAGVLSIARNVTTHKENKRQLRLLSQAIEQTPNSIIIANANREIEYVNKAFTRTTGYTAAEVIGRQTGFYASGDTPPETFESLWANLQAGKQWKGQFWNCAKDGANLTEVAHIAPIRDAKGQVTHYLSIQEDITRQVELADEVARALAAQEAAEAASQAKSRFLANMSHEIRTPMNAIIGLTHLLRQEPATPTQRDRIGKIAGAADHLLSLINDILDISKIEAGRLELSPSVFKISDVLEKLTTLMAQRDQNKKLLFATYIADIPPLLHGDVMRLTQILLNYLSNAIKFTQAGAIILYGNVIEETTDDVLVRFVVQDTGIGIPSEHQTRLFNAFEQGDNSTTRKYGGTGLGLRINRKLAQLMGGEVGVTSAPGAGSAFWVTLRLGKPPEGAQAEAFLDQTTPEDVLIEAASRRCANRKILLVEDNPINQEVALSLLQHAGLEAELAEDGLQALDAAGQKTFDLILMDMQMPVMDGIDATRALRRQPAYARTPIIAMTANAFNEDRQRCQDAGMNDFIAKPVTPSVLYATLIKWLGQDEDGTQAPRRPTESAPAPALASAAETPANPVRLDQTLGLKQLSGNAELYQRLLRNFADQAETDIAKMQDRLTAGDFEKLRKLVHTLKGSAGTLGALALHAMAQSLETRIREKIAASESGEEAQIVNELKALAGEYRHVAEDVLKSA